MAGDAVPSWSEGSRCVYHGGNAWQLREGYWVSPAVAKLNPKDTGRILDMIYECLSDKACDPGSEIRYGTRGAELARCSEGYDPSVPLCAGCLDNYYYNTLDGGCLECFPNSFIVSLILFTLVFLLLLLGAYGAAVRFDKKMVYIIAGWFTLSATFGSGGGGVGNNITADLLRSAQEVGLATRLASEAVQAQVHAHLWRSAQAVGLATRLASEAVQTQVHAHLLRSAQAVGLATRLASEAMCVDW
eukprot:gene9179-10878_t